MATKPEIKTRRGEKWVILSEKNALGQSYAISNWGRLVCFTKHLNSGHILNVSRQQGYPIWRSRKQGQHHAVLIHRMVAQYFLPRPKASRKFILHKNYNKEDNRVLNLAWATQEEITAHSKKNPLVKEFRKKILENHLHPNSTLSAANVKTIRNIFSTKLFGNAVQKFIHCLPEIHSENYGQYDKFLKCRLQQSKNSEAQTGDKIRYTNHENQFPK